MPSVKRAGALEPEADQQIGAQADPFPAEEHLNEVVGGHQRQHEEGKQAQIGHEPRDVRVVRHVTDRIDMHHRRDDRDHEHHHRGQGVEAQRPADFQGADVDPGEQLGGLALTFEPDGVENDAREHRRRQHRQHGDQLGEAVAQPVAKEAGKDGAEQGQKNGCRKHLAAIPSSC
jgi:hypothetical protein